ncbi:NUDIX domain-containing protein [Saccharopolyspora sp. K220]|uniref:NUDIX domain-containing protein n=1 Tax=Saccharopolyspora soli TaxID=2926618 RepID=UPI001F5612C2|nr:NUDIX domain-containing protein [Saccharopolyspora soli]MCI2418761.1 NUDIX domain-containing protein [Saccharopolyspora soli]
MSHIQVMLRCSVVVFFNDRVLLLRRRDQNDWALPGGTPRPGEDLLACVHRELREETGMLIDPGTCALIVETVHPHHERLIDLVFRSPERPAGQPRSSEDGLRPELVPLNALDGLEMHPPVATHLKILHAQPHPCAPTYVRYDWSETTPTPT